MLTYSPPVSRWGVAYLLHHLSTYEAYTDTAVSMMKQYLSIGRWLILALLAAMCTFSFSSKKWNSYEVGVLAYAMFLVLAPGFGNQYLVILVPMLLAVSIWRSWLYSALAGLFTLFLYTAYLVSYDIPWTTIFPPREAPAPGAIIGFLAWFVLLLTIARLVWRPASSYTRAGDN
jgi:hypothetical protein